MIYPTDSGGNIGTLLRLIREERGQMPHVVPPQAAPGTPLREMVTGPLRQVEAPESARVVSIRPELTLAPGAEPQVVPPVAPVAPAAAPAVTPPVAPSAPGVGPSAAQEPTITAAPSRPTPGPRPIGVSVKGPTFGFGGAVRGAGTQSPFAGQRLSAPPRATYGGTPILRTLATRIAPTLGRALGESSILKAILRLPFFMPTSLLPKYGGGKTIKG